MELMVEHGDFGRRAFNWVNNRYFYQFLPKVLMISKKDALKMQKSFKWESIAHRGNKSFPILSQNF